MNEQSQWYVTVEGNAVGPVSTDLVIRGIRHKKIATNAYVCIVGASEWQSLTDVAEFYEALAEGGLLDGAHPRNGHHHDAQGIGLAVATKRADPTESSWPLNDATDDDSETTASYSSQRPSELSVAKHAQAADAHAEPTESHSNVVAPRNGNHTELLLERRPMAPSMDLDIDVTVDDPHEARVNWDRGFSAYFLVDADVELPEENALLRSLASVPYETFLHDEAMWNLALCLAFGTDAVAHAAALVFFDVVTAHGLPDRIEWMSRTLMSRGFMPSGIPHAAGYRGLAQLRRVCPPGWQPKLEQEMLS